MNRPPADAAACGAEIRCFRPSPLAAFAGLDDGGVILHMGTKRYFSLNETGAAAWRMLEEGATAPRIVAHFVAGFEVDEATASAAVESLLAELRAEELLEADDSR